MDVSEAKKLAETVEAGLRDGRSLDSLRKAMKGSGYEDDDIREVLSHVDRKRIARRSAKKKPKPIRGLIPLVAGLIIVILVGYSLFSKGSGGAPEPGMNQTGAQQGLPKICYVLNETVKEKMIAAGAKCDKWYVIADISDTKVQRTCYVTNESVEEQMRQAGAECDRWYYESDLGNLAKYANATMTCYVVNETVKQEMISSGAKCDKWYLIQEL